MARPTTHVISGGTIAHVRPHLALCAPAFGATGEALVGLLDSHGHDAALHTTRLAGGPKDLETNDDVARLIDHLVDDADTRRIFMPVALCDYTGSILDDAAPTRSGRSEPRLESRGGVRHMLLTPAAKVIGAVRKRRKDIFLVGFKSTAGSSPAEQFESALRLLKTTSCNLVLANDLHTGFGQIVTPEEASYHAGAPRTELLRALVDIALARSRSTFTRTTLVPGAPVAWSSGLVPPSLRSVVDHCTTRGAYKPFLGNTAGHFALSLGAGRFLTSRRKSDFNHLADTGLVLVQADGTERVVAHGFKPSVGGQSQRIVFEEHPGFDCIVHFHCPMRVGSHVPVREQRGFECGSHECGKNTSDGLTPFDDGLLAVMLDNHGPNVVFRRDVDPEKVIRFIEANFDLDASTRPRATDADGLLSPACATVPACLPSPA